LIDYLIDCGSRKKRPTSTPTSLLIRHSSGCLMFITSDLEVVTA